MSQLWERKPIADASLSVVVLANGASTEAVQTCLAELNKVLTTRKSASEVIIPATAAQEASLQPAMNGISPARFVVDESVSAGIGAALKVGIAATQYPLLMTLPVGYSPKYLSNFLKEIDLVDIVAGVRESKVKGWQRRQFFSKAYQLFGLWLQDPECGMKLYRREVFDRLPIQSRGSFVQIEILAKANFQSRILTEVVIEGPVTEPEKVGADFWKVLNNPNFGPPPEKVVEETVKPMFTKNLPSAPVTPDQKVES